MDGSQIYAVSAPSRLAACAEPRTFLFLQGPISSFFDRLGRALIARGHRAHRINLHFGDQLLWRSPATHFRGRFEDWRAFVAEFMDREQITDLVLHGDRRPYHLVAAEEARARGIAVLATDLGYVRPDWLTLEYDGMTTYSRFPRDPKTIRALAAEFPEPELEQRFQTPFWLIAGFDILYNLGLVLGRPLYPHYRYHSTCHPFLEYAGWLGSRPKKVLQARETSASKLRLQSAPGSYFLVPLQLTTDFQIRAHSPFWDLRDAIREIVRSYAVSGAGRRLVFVIHPLDNGLVGWQRLIAQLAREMGVADRVLTLHGGTPTDLLRNAAGVVTVNSTVGITALCHGVPVKALGNAIFDVAGLTCQAPLDEFWRQPPPPDRTLLAAFLRALVGTTQVKGGYYERGSQECAIAGFVQRIEERPYPLPPLTSAELALRAPRPCSRSVAVTGASGAAGRAMARVFAEPGVRLCLTGTAAAPLARVAADCRQRGALVETKRAITGTSFPASLDLLVVHTGARGDLLAAMDTVAAALTAIRCDGSGGIVLIAGQPAGEARREKRDAYREIRAWTSYAAALRSRLCRDGIKVVAAVPSRLAIWAAAWLNEPALASVNAERAAELLRRGVARGRETIALPGPVLTAGQVLALLRRRLRDAIRTAARPGAEAIDVPRAPLASEPGTGD